ncbi:CPBP family intramembrane metalloprotease [Actinotalea ferrariae]|uniref:CPBP family intramembrane glutamic endopeptidase n=1 Tax=Actinotalea ferrariae TaxID=1386098 RepID=UPI001C8C2E4E|nr:CPBP family intramembrane glutamic endopeptidase [Actinotalea ferrariae]MBX9245820.1 CPBP family intramembrane metalloprotease [Actinotalea ferrariae]
MRVVKQLGAVVVVAVPGSAAVHAAQGSWPLALVAGVVVAVAMVLAYAWVVRRTERRPASEVALAGGGSDLRRGVGIGVLVFVTVIAVIALAGGYRVEGWGSPATALAFLGLTVAAVATEELIFRGIVQRVLEQRVGTWVALGATAALFGGMHLANANATLWGAVAIAIEAGGMLGAAYVLTRTLWLPMGLHLGWNLAVGGIFGTEVSGNATPQGLLDGVTSGPVWLTGGAFGPEGSVVAVVVCSVVTVVLLRLAHRRGRIVLRRRVVEPAVASAPAATVSA